MFWATQTLFDMLMPRNEAAMIECSRKHVCVLAGFRGGDACISKVGVTRKAVAGRRMGWGAI